MTKITKRNKLITLCASAALLCLLEANQTKAASVNIITSNTDKDKYIDNSKDKHNEISDAQEQLKQVVGEISEVSDRLAKIAEQCDSYQEKIDQIKKKKQDAIEQLASLEKQESEAKNLLDPVNNDYLAAKEEYEKLCEEKNKASDKLASHKESIKETKAKLEKKEAQLKDIEDELQSLNDKLKNFFDTKLKNNTKYERMLWKLETLYPSQKENHASMYEDYKNDYEKAQKEYDQLKDDPTADKKTINDLLRDISFNKISMEKEQDILDGIEESIATDQQNIIKLQNAYLNDPVVKSIKEQEIQLTEDKTNYQQELKLLQEEVSKSNSNVADNENFEKINSDIVKVQNKLDILSQKLSVQNQNLSEIGKKIDDQKAASASTENEKTEVTQVLSKLLAEKEAEVKRLNELKQEKVKLEDLLEVLQRYHAVFPEDQDKNNKPEQDKETSHQTDKINEKKDPIVKKDKDDVKKDKNWIIIFHKEVPQNTEKAKVEASKEKTKTEPRKEPIKVSQVKLEKGHLLVKINQSWHKISSTKVNKLFKKNYKFKASGKIKQKTNFYDRNGKKLKKVAKAGKKIKVSQIKLINQKMMVKLATQNKWLPLTKVSFK